MKSPDQLSGEELSRAVATEVMGDKPATRWNVVDAYGVGQGYARDEETAIGYAELIGARVVGVVECAPYADYIADAWRVVKKMRKDGWGFSMCDGRLNGDEGFFAVFGKSGCWTADLNWFHWGDSTPLAICRAALAAVRARRKQDHPE